jgi:urease accessory protein
MPTSTDLPNLLRLLQLFSPALPVGAFTWSQGLESAIAAGWLRDEAALKQWLWLQLQHSLVQVDLPLLLRLHAAASVHDRTALLHWNAFALACRESAELLKNDSETAAALVRLLTAHQVPLLLDDDNSALSVYAQAAVHWQIPAESLLSGWLWAWLENQVMAATRLLALGHTSAQLLLSALQQQLPAMIQQARACADEALGASLPALAIISMQHETMDTRLFRS